jgi:predicted RND superfamily exporter protein
VHCKREDRLSEPTDLAGFEGVLSLEWLFAAAVTLGITAALATVARRPDWVVGRPLVVLLLLLGVSGAAGFELFRLDPPGVNLLLDPSTEPLLPSGDPGQALYQRAVLNFGDDEVYVVAIECEEVFSQECLGVVDRLSTKIVQFKEVRSISSLMDVTSFRYVREEDWVEVRPFIDDVPSDAAKLADLRRRALNDPVYVRSIVSEDARTAAININFRKMTDGELIDSRLDERIIELLEEELGASGRGFYVSGRPHFKTHVYHGMVRDLRFVLPLSVVVMSLVLWIFSGTMRGMLLPLAVALSSILWTFGAMAFLGRSLTLLTGLVGPMLLAIGSIYGVHMLARYEEEAARAKSPREAALESLRHMLVPVTIAGLTTILGFAALLITDVPAVFELGCFSMLGIGGITLSSLTGAPAALAMLPLRSRPRASFSAKLADRLDLTLGALAGSVSRHATPVLVVAGAVVVAAMLLLPAIVIDTDYLSYFDEKDPVRSDFEAVNSLLSGAVPLYVVIEGDGPGAFREPAVVGAIEEIQERADRVVGVGRTLSFADSMRMLNRAFNQDDPAHEIIPDTRPGVTELLFMIPKNELQRFTTVNHGLSNVILRTGEVGSSAILRLVSDVEAQLDEIEFPEGIVASVTGNAILLARSADGIAKGQPVSVGIAAISIFLLVSVGLRSLGIGAVAMVPNLIPVLVYFGVLGLGAAPLSLPTSLIGCMALGIAIDDTVHYVVRYRAERRAGAEPAAAARLTTRFVGRPIAITSAVISLGFLMVTLSDFATLQEFGLLSALTMGICLVTDLVLLPAILVRARL